MFSANWFNVKFFLFNEEIEEYSHDYTWKYNENDASQGEMHTGKPMESLYEDEHEKLTLEKDCQYVNESIVNRGLDISFVDYVDNYY